MSIRTLTKETIKKKGLSIKFPMRKGVDGAFQVNETTIDVVKDGLKLLLLTNYGERLIHVDFGANLRPLIFENMSEDLNVQIETAILTAVERWMPFVLIKEVQIKDYTQDLSIGDNELRIKIFFSISNTGLEDFLVVRLKA